MRFFLLVLNCAISINLYGNDRCKKNGKWKCCNVLTKQAPFYISNTFLQGAKEYENFRSIENDDVVDKYLPQNTILAINPSLYDIEAKNSFRLPFEVVSIPSVNNEDFLLQSKKSEFKKKFEGISKLERVKKGDVGFVDFRSIKKVDSYLFLVNKDIPVFNSDRELSLKNRFLELKKIDDYFIYEECCKEELVRNDINRLCVKNYVYNVVDDNEKEFGDISFYHENPMCSIRLHLDPISKEQADIFKEIVTLLSDDYVGIGKVYKERSREKDSLEGNKVKLIRLGDILGAEDLRIMHYSPDDIVKSDTFMKPESACSFLKLVKKFNEQCGKTGCKTQVGNMFHLKSWGVHKSHFSGECIDLRPYRLDDDMDEGLTWSKLNSRYDQEKTLEFLKLAISYGATDIFFNDPEIIKYFSNPKNRKMLIGKIRDNNSYDNWWKIGVRKLVNHDDHIHLCFRENNKRVQQNCSN